MVIGAFIPQLEKQNLSNVPVDLSQSNAHNY